MNQEIRNLDFHICQTSANVYRLELIDAKSRTPLQNDFVYSSEDFDKLQKALGTLQRSLDRELMTEFGKRLYDMLLSAERISYLKEVINQSESLRLRFIIDDYKIAGLPWELLYDGENFLGLIYPISRLVIGAAHKRIENIPYPLRILAIISSPLDLGEDLMLDVEKEQEIIMASFSLLVSEGKAEIVFVEEASVSNIGRLVTEEEYHIIHFSGHGKFDEISQKNYLLLEDDNGQETWVSADEISYLFSKSESTRLVVLGGCQTAKVSESDFLTGLPYSLLKRNVSAYVGFQHSIPNQVALRFFESLYIAIAKNYPIEECVFQARTSLASKYDNHWFTPAIFSKDFDGKLFHFDQSLPRKIKIPSKRFVSLLPEENFVGRRREIREIRKALLSKRTTFVVIHGPGGIGKTALAAKASQSVANEFDGILSITCRPSASLEEMLFEINSVLVFNGIDTIRNTDITSQAIDELIQLLNRLKLILIFDDFDALLDEDGKIKPEFNLFFQTLLKEVSMSKIMITSRRRIAFDDSRNQHKVFYLALGELTLSESLRLMNDFESLAKVDIPTKQKIYERLGGYPLVLTLFAHAAKYSSVDDALHQLDSSKSEFDLKSNLSIFLEAIFNRLSPKSQDVMLRCSVLRSTFSYQVIKSICCEIEETDSHEAIDELAQHSLILYDEDKHEYSIHPIIKNFFYEKLDESQRQQYHLDAAKFFESVFGLTPDFSSHIEARFHYFEAKEYQKAATIANNIFWNLYSQGSVELAIQLLTETIETTEGKYRAVSSNNLGILFQEQGRYVEAIQLYNKSLNIKQQFNDQKGIAITLHQLGTIHHRQGNYERAKKFYTDSREVAEKLNDRNMLAANLYQLGMIAQDLGDYEQAVQYYGQSIKNYEELELKNEISLVYHQLANVHHRQYRYEDALRYYNNSLRIQQELGNQAGIANLLHNIGIIHQEQGRYEDALRYYNDSLRIQQELGDQPGMSQTLYQLGVLNQQKNQYAEAMEMYKHSSDIFQQLSDQVGIAITSRQLGMLFQQQGQYTEAMQMYERSLDIFQQLNDQISIAHTLHQLGILYQDMNQYGEAAQMYERGLEIFHRLGDQVGIGITLYQLGNSLMEQGKNSESLPYLGAALVIFDQSHLLRERDFTGGAIAEVRKRIGEEVFKTAFPQAKAKAKELLSIREMKEEI
ncbi:tetratricopeptide repeat protein [bacterium]|nr:tetratricopeptide repeat protein [bacterium]